MPNDEETERLTPGQPQAPGPAAPVVPVRYGRVRIERLLGRGGMGEVHLGYHEGFDVPVAVKLLPVRSGDPEHVERFLREARVLVRLDHPAIVRVFDVGHESGRFFLVMEYVEGQDVEAYARDRGGRLPVAEAVSIVEQAARGLDHAHRQGVLHRDVKPANLMRRARDGRVKVLDFGLARAAGMDQLTTDGAMMGTLPYMAYEQLLGDPEAASDVYSLGVTLYRLVSGQVPVKGDLSDLMRYHIEGRPRPIGELRAVPQGLDDLMHRVLAREPARRPAAEEFADELHRIGEVVEPSSRGERVGRAVAELIASPTATGESGAAPRSRRTRWLVAGAALAVALAAGGYARMHTTPGPETPPPARGVPSGPATPSRPGSGAAPTPPEEPGVAPWPVVLHARKMRAVPLYYPYVNKKYRSLVAAEGRHFLVVRLRIPSSMRGVPADRPGFLYTAGDFALLDASGGVIRNEDWVGWERLAHAGSYEIEARGSAEGKDPVFADDEAILYSEDDVPGTLFPGWVAMTEGTREFTVREPEIPGPSEDVDVGFLLTAGAGPERIRFRDQAPIDIPW